MTFLHFCPSLELTSQAPRFRPKKSSFYTVQMTSRIANRYFLLSLSHPLQVVVEPTKQDCLGLHRQETVQLFPFFQKANQFWTRRQTVGRISQACNYHGPNAWNGERCHTIR